MKTITFKHDMAHGVYHSMIEGMAEIALDDGDHALVGQYDALLQLTGGSEVAVYPASFEVPVDLVELAERVLQNCEDNNDQFDSVGAAEEDPELMTYYIFCGDVVISDD